jgi:hypothetical protein
MRLLQAESLSKIGRFLFWFGAAVWIAFGVFGFVRLGDWSGRQLYVMLAVAILMLGNAVALGWFGWMIGGEPPRYLRLALFYVFLNLVLSLMDQFGLADLLYLVYCLILFVLCLRLYLLTHRRIR